MVSPPRLDDGVDEEAPLLPVKDNDTSLKSTPLPTSQIAVLASVWLAETVVEISISPYLNQLIRDLPIVGGDERKVGYYAGIMVSLHYAAEAMTTLHWNRLSDYIGRKPVLLSCSAGTTLSIILFGFSGSFSTLVLSRCLHGALKGNIGVVKSTMAEITDETNVARGFSLLPMTWAIGFLIGPSIGGILSQPQARWPHLFSSPFWAKYPYLLPCLAAAAFSFLSFGIIAKYMKETVIFTPSATPQSVMTSPNVSQEELSDILEVSPKDAEKPLPLRSLLTRPVVISIGNFAMLALLDMVSLVLIPLIWSTSVKFGGLGLSPVSIGLYMSIYGCVGGICQFAFSPYAIRRFGPRRVFIAAIAASAVVYAMFPLQNFVLRHIVRGASVTVWLLIFLQLSAMSINNMGYCAVYMYISSSAPNRRSLGATNGLAQTLGSIQRTVGQAAADWLFAFTITNNIMGGYFVYVVLLSMTCAGLFVAVQLPRHMWTHSSK